MANVLRWIYIMLRNSENEWIKVTWINMNKSHVHNVRWISYGILEKWCHSYISKPIWANIIYVLYYKFKKIYIDFKMSMHSIINTKFKIVIILVREEVSHKEDRGDSDQEGLHRDFNSIGMFYFLSWKNLYRSWR